MSVCLRLWSSLTFDDLPRTVFKTIVNIRRSFSFSPLSPRTTFKLKLGVIGSAKQRASRSTAC